MKRSAALLVLMAVGIVAAAAAAPVDKGALAKKQSSLNSEYALAKESQFYFVLDVLGRKLELRVRGMVLRSWPLQSMRFWGRPDFSGTVELVRKTTLKAPQRIVIKPGSEEAQPAPAAKPTPTTGAAPANPAEFDLEALELKDMPKRFSLDFDNGLHVTVRSKGAGSGGWLRSLGAAWRWYINLPLKNLLGGGRGKGLSELELIFDGDKDAQAIYWHFFEGIKGIIL
jgi:hypothetical protein